VYIATEDPTAPENGDLAGAVADLGIQVASELIDILGPTGTATLLLIVDVVMAVKYPQVRRAHVAVFMWAWDVLELLYRLRTNRSAIRATKEERRIMKRLAPAHWKEHAAQRGLDGTITSTPRLTNSGIVCQVRLDGTWTATKLRGAEDHVRSLLGVRSDLRIETKAGKRGGWAELILRTRSASDGDDLKWTPERNTFGVDTVTGKQVTIPLGERLLIAGMSGAGKSVCSRPLLYDASEGESNALVIIDLKQVEGRLWDHRARVASDPEDVITVVDELVEEMHSRLSVLPKGQDKWTPTPERPRITVVVDEGAEVVTAAKDALEGLETLARMGRAACVDLWWMTQKPTIGDGIPKQIAPQLSTRICLCVSTPTEARVVLGEDAQAKGWHADALPKPGYALVRDGNRKPDPVKVRFMTTEAVIALPDRPIWRGRPAAPMAPVVDLRKPPAPPTTPTAVTTEERVLHLVKEAPVRQKDIAERTGLAKGTVSKVVKVLIEKGRLVRLEDGSIAPREEATA
jgi:hypothetical protein